MVASPTKLGYLMLNIKANDSALARGALPSACTSPYRTAGIQSPRTHKLRLALYKRIFDDGLAGGPLCIIRPAVHDKTVSEHL